MLEAVSANAKTQLDTVNAVFGAFSGKEGGLSLTIENVQKLACQKAEPQPGYNCDMIVHMKMGEHQQQQQQSARFVKSDQGWLIVE